MKPQGIQGITDFIFEKLLTIIVWILGIVLIYWLILKLTDHSPTFIQLVIVVGGIIGTLVIRHHYNFGRFDEFRHATAKEFARVTTKLDKLDADITLLRVELASIKSCLEKQDSKT